MTGGVASTGDIRFDGSWIKNVDTGNIYISPQDGNTWLTLPSDSQAGSGPVNLGNSDANGVVQITAGNTYKNWTFSHDGNLTLPLGGTVKETQFVSGGSGDDTPGTLVLTPNGVYNPWNNLTIYNTAFNPETQHIHLASGDLNRTEIVLGNDSKFVKVNIDGSVCVNSSPYYFEDAMAFEFQNTDNTITEMHFSLGVYPRLYNVAVGDIITDVSNGNTAIITGVDNAINLSITCSIPMDTNGTSTLGYSFSKPNNNGGLWQFGSDGNLTLPNGQSIGSGIRDGIKMTTDRGTVLFGNSPECVPTLLRHFHIMKDDPASVDLFLGDDNNYVKLPGGGETAYGVEIGTNVGSAYTWRFGTDGTLTFPDLTVQTTAFELQGLPPSTAWGTTYPAGPGVANMDYQFFFDGGIGYPTMQSYASAGGNPLYNSIWSVESVINGAPTYTSSGATPVQVNNTGGVGIFAGALSPGDYVIVRIQNLDTGRIYRATFMGSYFGPDVGNEVKYGSITVERLL